MRPTLSIVASSFFLATLPVLALHPAADPPIIVPMSGLQEVGDDGTLGVGDPDGTAVAELFWDHGDLLWRINYRNVSGEQVSGFHIHGPGATPATNAPVFIDLLAGTTQDPMVLPTDRGQGYLLARNSEDIARVRQVFTNPGGFYINLHTSGAGGFPDGAVRGQLPEPAAAGALTLSAALATLRRRTRNRPCAAPWS